MNRTEALREHLRALLVDQVADALGTLGGGPDGLGPGPLHHRLSILSYRPEMVAEFTLTQCQLLRVADEIAVPEPGRGTYDPALTKALQSIGYGENLIVDWQRVLELMDVRGGEGRRVAEEMIAGLASQALTWPTGRGEYHLVTGVVETYGIGHQRPPLVSEALDTCYNVTEVRRVALAWGWTQREDVTRDSGTSSLL